MSKKITLIAALGSPERRVRLFKSVNVFKNFADCDIEFWGWRRETDEVLGADWNLISSQRAILSGGGYRNASSKPLYILWALSVFFNVVFNGPKRIYCLGLETAAPVWFATRIRRKSKYVFDDADRLVMAWKLPKHIESVVRWIEKKASNASEAHIIPVKELYDYSTDKMCLVYNMPTTAQIIEAKSLPLPQKKDGLVVYVNGTLNPTRNMEAIEKCAKLLSQESNTKIFFKLATPKRIDGADQITTLYNVENLGWLPQDKALAHYRNSDVVLTLLDVNAVQSYRFAWPNKWGDAVSMGTPIIVNNDMITAQPFLESGMAINCKFGSAEALFEVLTDLSNNPNKLDSAKLAIQRASQLYPSFDIAVKPALERLIK